MRPSRVVLVGATGTFGCRLAAMLAGMPGLDLVLAARGVEALDRLCAQLRPHARCAGLSRVCFDRLRPDGLAALEPWVVVDAAGPFQAADYRLAIAAAEAGAHYIDLADGRTFVAGFPEALRTAAMAAGTLAVTGASSTPALSHAAAHTLTAGWQCIDAIHVAILPGARAPRGLSVMAAILHSVGQPVRVFCDGLWREVPGWSSPRRLDVPGLGRRWASICDTPDLDLLPHHFAVRRTALFTAGLELSVMHLGLAALGFLVRRRLVASLRPLARPLRIVAGLFAPFGTDRGGMTVEACGVDATGNSIRARWTLLAEANAGPHTPAAAAAALVRALLAGEMAVRSACSAAGLLPLNTILNELAALPIRTVVDEGHPDNPALFRRLLGRHFASLPQPVRIVHNGTAPSTFGGRAVVRAGRGLIPKLLRLLLGLPRSGATPFAVEIVPDRDGERWTRSFGASRFASRLVSSRTPGTFEEKIGPLRFRFRMALSGRGVVWHRIGWSIAGLRLPLAVAPEIHAAAEECDSGYRFRVVVAHPWTGLLFAYRGTLRAMDPGRPEEAPFQRSSAPVVANVPELRSKPRLMPLTTQRPSPRSS